MLALAAELRAQGRDIISLGAGEPDFDTPQSIKDAATQAIADGATKYTPIDGTAALKAAVQRKFARENSLDYNAPQILVTSGAKQALFNLCLALLSPNDEVIIPAPYWVSYPDMVRLADAEPVIIETGLEANFKITAAQLAAAITANTRLLFLNSPSNPTGASYSKSELQALGEVLAGHPKILIAADDIYEHIQWADEPFVSFATVCPDLYDRTLTINGVSKAYAMTGWRIGYAAGPATIIKAMKTIQSQSTSNACSVSQVAAAAALDGDQAPVAAMTAAAAAITANTRLLFLNSPSNPTGASYSKSELQALGEVLAGHPKILIAADDIYEHIQWADEPFVSFATVCPDLYDRTLTINGVSKAYAMTGWRIGYAAGPATIIKAMKTIQSQSTSNACSVSQVAAAAALDGDQAPVVAMTAAYKQRHDYIVAALNDLDGFECRPGEGTFYAFPRISGVLQAKGLAGDADLVELLIEKADVAPDVTKICGAL